jgi:hypothetical protein
LSLIPVLTPSLKVSGLTIALYRIRNNHRAGALRKMIHTSTRGGYVHRNDKTVVATFFIDCLQDGKCQGIGLPPLNIAIESGNACVSLDPCRMGGGIKPRDSVPELQCRSLSRRCAGESTVESVAVEHWKIYTFFMYEGS